MTESEKATRTIAEFETEVAGLAADVATLEAQLSTATTTAEQAIAAAERRADDAAQAAAVDAEQERQRLAAALSRKRLALVAATADLTTARHGLAASQRAARFVQLQTILDALAVAAGAIDEDPTYLDNWIALHELITSAQPVYVAAGGKGRLIESAVWARGQLFGSIATRIDWTLGSRAEAPKPIPAMATLLQLPHAAGRVRELMMGKS